MDLDGVGGDAQERPVSVGVQVFAYGGRDAAEVVACVSRGHFFEGENREYRGCVVWCGPCHEVDHLFAVEVDDAEACALFDGEGVAMASGDDVFC